MKKEYKREKEKPITQLGIPMNNPLTLQGLRDLRLWGMATHFEQILALPIHQQPPADTLLAQLVESEAHYREHRRYETLLKAARFRYQASVAEVICSAARNLDQALFLRLAEGSFIHRGENVFITGATGCGKSYVASALGHQACRQGYHVLYYNLTNLLEKLHSARADGSYMRELARIGKQQLLILDDWGIPALDQQARLSLLQIMEDRHSRAATIITLQLPVSKWYDYLGEPTFADAILDRLIHQAHRIELKGPSMRGTNRPSATGSS